MSDLNKSAFCGGVLGGFIKSPFNARGCDTSLFLGINTNIIRYSIFTGTQIDYITLSDLTPTLDFPSINTYLRHSEKGIYVRHLGVNSPSPTVIYRWTLFNYSREIVWTISEDQTITKSGSDYVYAGVRAVKPDGDLVVEYKWNGVGATPANFVLHATYSSASGGRTDTFVFTIATGLPSAFELAYGASNLYGTTEITDSLRKYDATGSAEVKVYEFESDPYDASTSYDHTAIGDAPETSISTSGLWTIKGDTVYTMGAPRNYPYDDDTDQFSVFKFNAADSVTDTALPHASNTIHPISLTPDGLFLFVQDGSTIYKLDTEDLSTVWTVSASGITQGTAGDSGGLIVNKSGGVAYYNPDGELKWSAAGSASHISGRPFDIT